MLALNVINKSYLNSIHNLNGISFKGVSRDNISSNSKSKYVFLELYNPITKGYCSTVSKTDLSKPHQFELEDSFDIFTGDDSNKMRKLIIDYDPNFNDELTNKITNEPIPVNILHGIYEDSPEHEFYYFMSKDLKYNYGYVWITNTAVNKNIPKMLKQDYPKQGICGNRVVVEYLKNMDEEICGGVGKLADKIEVKYCLENGLAPNIISEAKYGTSISHYKRGKRFIEPEKGSISYNHLMSKYSNSNPNEILENLIKNSPQDKNIDADVGYLLMYLPKNMIKKYIDELKKSDNL